MADLSFVSRVQHLLDTPLFQQDDRDLAYEDQCRLLYRRARVVAREYALTAQDVMLLSSKFWELHQDNISARYPSVFILLTIQYNLSIGTFAPFAMKRKDLRPILQKMLDFDVSAQFLMTEVSRGLDAINLETTATVLDNGEFDLHSPTEGSAKIMPPTSPYCGMPRVGIVIARLIVNSNDHGLRPFLVSLGDGEKTCKGVTCQLLPGRLGSSVDHSITTFTHVRLPSSALLGSLSKPSNMRLNFLQITSRVSVGTIAVALGGIIALANSAYIAASCSLRRKIGDPKSPAGLSPVWAFRTQQLPILHAMAQVYVFKAFAREVTMMYKDRELDVRTRMGIATAFKVVIFMTVPRMITGLADRCGAQGLFAHNQMLTLELASRGAAIAEGDILVLSIRLATELLLGRYKMPRSRHPDCLLAQHESNIFTQCKAKLRQMGDHRGETFNRLFLPLCQHLVLSIGHRIAYEAALDDAVPEHHLRLFEVFAMKSDAGWYNEFAGIGWWKHNVLEEEAATGALRFFERDLEGLGVEPFVTAPVTSDQKWEDFVKNIPRISPGFSGQEIIGSDVLQQDTAHGNLYRL